MVRFSSPSTSVSFLNLTLLRIMSDLSSFGASTLVNTCAQVKENELAMIIVTPQTIDVGFAVFSELSKATQNIVFECMPERGMHGQEPTESVAMNMLKSDVIFCLTPMSLAHTQARKSATGAGARYLSLPDYSMDVLQSKALHTDFTALVSECDGLADVLDHGAVVHVTNTAGTNIEFSIKGRHANRCPGIVNKSGQLGSPPDAEVNIAPLEGYGNGVIVVDGSIPCREVGLLSEPVSLTVQDSKVVKVSSPNKSVELAVQKLFSSAGEKSKIIGEFGIGLNPNAELCGVMLEDEGCAGTVHFGIGSSATIGGTNDVAFHLDFILRSPSVTVDGAEVISNGEITTFS